MLQVPLHLHHHTSKNKDPRADTEVQGTEHGQQPRGTLSGQCRSNVTDRALMFGATKRRWGGVGVRLGLVWCGGVGVEWVGGWSGMVRTSLSSECASSTLSSPWYITHGVHVVMPGRRMRPGKDDDTSTSSRFPAFLSTHTCTQGGHQEEWGQCSRQRRNALYTHSTCPVSEMAARPVSVNMRANEGRRRGKHNSVLAIPSKQLRDDRFVLNGVEGARRVHHETTHLRPAREATHREHHTTTVSMRRHEGQPRAHLAHSCRLR